MSGGGIGGKAAALRSLERAGFPVPGFAVLPADAIVDGAIRPEPWETLLASLPGAGPFAVRSSGGAEDGASASHAGQYLTRLGVEKTDLEDAILAVWRSGAADHVAAYQAARGLGGTGASPPSVIVQRMLRPRAAGVAFSADPVSGSRNTLVVSAVAGLADRLVSGELDGTDYRIARSGVAPEAGDGPLTTNDLLALRDLVLHLEAHFGSPQDVEWAFDADGLHVLQSRPITTLGAAGPTDDRLVILDNSNIVESYPGFVSPLTFSFARGVYAEVYRQFLLLLGVPPETVGRHRATLQNLLARHEGRAYYNLVEWYRALALLPGFRLNRRAMEAMMGVGEALPAELANSLAPPPASGPGKFKEALRVGRSALALLWQAAILKRTIRRFEARLDRALAPDSAAVAAMPLSALAAEYRRIEADLLERWDAPLVNDFLCMIAFSASRALLKRWAGPAGETLHGDIMVGQGDIISAEPAQRVRRMGEIARGDPALAGLLSAGSPAALHHPVLGPELAAYLDRFGDRCVEELKLESVPLSDDPAPLIRAVAAATLAPDRTVERTSAEDGFEAAFRGRPLRRAVASAVAGYAKRRVRDRENLRFQRTRLFGRARRVFLAIGARLHEAGRLDGPRDVFLLSVDEALSAIEGAAVSFDLRGLAELRRRELAGFAAGAEPAERLTFRGAAVTASPAASAPATVATGEVRRGTGCAAGVVTGLARVVRDPATERVEPGEILVARHTDPGWIALFANAAGIVVERGSLLSHSAIVARELGIPCVVGVKGACAWLRSGDRVHLDGAAGTVERLENADG